MVDFKNEIKWTNLTHKLSNSTEIDCDNVLTEIAKGFVVGFNTAWDFLHNGIFPLIWFLV